MVIKRDEFKACSLENIHRRTGLERQRAISMHSDMSLMYTRVTPVY